MINLGILGRGGLAAATLLASAASASAAVVYDFSETGGDFGSASFTYSTGALITSDQTVMPQTCTIANGYTCSSVTFDVSPNGEGGTDDLVRFNYISSDGGSGTIFFFFQQGAFGAFGAYSDVGFPVGTPGAGNGAPATLTVSDSAAAVPEPATWAMMLLGFGGLGTALRRGRAAAYS